MVSELPASVDLARNLVSLGATRVLLEPGPRPGLFRLPDGGAVRAVTFRERSAAVTEALADHDPRAALIGGLRRIGLEGNATPVADAVLLALAGGAVEAPSFAECLEAVCRSRGLDWQSAQDVGALAVDRLIAHGLDGAAAGSAAAREPMSRGRDDRRETGWMRFEFAPAAAPDRPVEFAPYAPQDLPVEFTPYAAQDLPVDSMPAAPQDLLDICANMTARLLSRGVSPSEALSATRRAPQLPKVRLRPVPVASMAPLTANSRQIAWTAHNPDGAPAGLLREGGGAAVESPARGDDAEVDAAAGTAGNPRELAAVIEKRAGTAAAHPSSIRAFTARAMLAASVRETPRANPEWRVARDGMAHSAGISEWAPLEASATARSSWALPEASLAVLSSPRTHEATASPPALPDARPSDIGEPRDWLGEIARALADECDLRGLGA